MQSGERLIQRNCASLLELLGRNDVDGRGARELRGVRASGTEDGHRFDVFLVSAYCRLLSVNGCDCDGRQHGGDRGLQETRHDERSPRLYERVSASIRDDSHARKSLLLMPPYEWVI